MVQRQYFHDALVFFGVTARARASGGSELQYWLKLASAQRQRRDTEPTNSRKKRRRRGRSRKRGDKGNQGPKPSTPAAHG